MGVGWGYQKSGKKCQRRLWMVPIKKLTCSVFFFRCVQNDQCDGLINIRGLDDLVTTNLVCDDPNHTCCHESVLKNLNQCQKYYEMGYRYVHKQ